MRPDRRACWRELPERVDATNDFFIRTTDASTRRSCRSSSQRIYDSGDIYEDVYSGLYCVALRGVQDARPSSSTACAPIHGTPPEWIEEKNWFFRLSAYQDRLLAALRRAARFRAAALPLQRGAELHRGRPPGLQRQPRRPAVGRADPLGRRAGHLRLGRRAHQLPQRAQLRAPRRGSARRRSGPHVRHLLGKDILRFHCVFWPALLLAAGYEVPQQLFIHGFLLLDDRKISKSLGNVIDPLDLVDVYGVGRAALLGAARGRVRAGRQRVGRRAARALRARARATTSATSSRARPRWSPATATGASRPWRPKRRARRAALEASGASRGASTPRLHGRARAVWELVRALNRFVEASARRGSWRRTRRTPPASSTQTLTTLAEGCASLRGPALAVPAGEGAAHARTRSASRRARARAGRRRPAAPGRRIGRGRSSRASTRPRGVIDTHAHLRASTAARACVDRGGRGGRRRAHRLRG